MNISFKEWLYKESAQNDAVENLKNSLLELTDKSKYDLVMFFQKAIRTPKDEIKDIEFPHTAYHSNFVEIFKKEASKFKTEKQKNDEISKLIRGKELELEELSARAYLIKSIIDDVYNFDQSKREKFRNNDLEFFIKKAAFDFMTLMYTIPELASKHTDNFHVNKNDFEPYEIAMAVVNPFSYLNKDDKYKIQDFINLSNEKFIKEMKIMALGKDKGLNKDHLIKRSKEISGYGGDDEKSSIADIAVAGSNSLDPRSRRVIKRRSGETMLSFPSNDYEYEYDDSKSDSESESESKSKYVLSDDEFNEFKKIIHEEASRDELKKFVFCTREGLEFDKLLVPNYYTDIYEIIRNQNRLKSLRGNGKYVQIYEIIRNMIESSDINEKRKGIKLQMYLGADEQGNFPLGRGKDQFIDTIKSTYAEVINKIVSRSKLISDNPKWLPILKKWKSK